MGKTKKWFYRILIIILVIVLYRFVTDNYYYKNSKQTDKPTLKQQSQAVYLKVDGQKDFSKQSFETNKTALELTKENTKVVTKGDGVNAYIVEINGRLAEDSKKEFWAFYVNGKQAEVGAGSYILKEGDKIEWRIETY